MKNRKIIIFIAVIVVIASVDILFFYKSIIVGASYFYNENNALENTQVVLLFISMVVFLFSLVNAEKSNRIIFFTGALLCFSFILRELDVEEFNLPQVIIFFGSGYGKKVMLVALWLLVFIVILKRFSYYREVIARLIFSMLGLLFFISGVFLFIGDFFEKNILGLEFYQFYEELSELNGYFFILIASIATPFALHGITSHSR